jgi:hypothetical protein
LRRLGEHVWNAYGLLWRGKSSQHVFLLLMLVQQSRECPREDRGNCHWD